jgi:hypothetical protein
MKKLVLVVIIIFSIILIGFLIGLILPGFGGACTLMGCPCEQDGERPCNSC